MGDFSITADHPGGNIQVVSSQGDVVRLRQEIRDTGEWWFYWNFRARGMQGRRVTFRFVDGDVVGPYGPCVSDDGVLWEWAGEQTLLGRDGFAYAFAQDEEDKLFAFSLPYQLSHLEAFLGRNAGHPLLRRDVLCRTAKGRDIPLLTIGRGGRSVFFCCRHHACESTAAYALEGAMQSLLSERPALLEAFTFSILPIADIDGVEEGDQGKSRLPHDHNRDFLDEPIYPYTRALYDLVAKRRPEAFLDFHSPFKWGGRHDQLLLVEGDPPAVEGQREFSGALERAVAADPSQDKIPYRTENNLPRGVDWNVGDNRTASWYFAKEGARLSATLEIPYFGKEGVVHTQENLRGLGRNIAGALEAYLCPKEKLEMPR